MKLKTSEALFPKPFAVGDYVEVMEDFSPNRNRHKGIGWVTKIKENNDGDLSLTVQLLWFKEIVFPAIKKLVGKGGKYEGYRPIIQGDNAGPHRDERFMNYVKDFCERMGWYWEPQGPQMPHINVLDLAVFPQMSRNHCELVRRRGGMRVLKEDEIWDGAENVWRHMPSCDVARAFVLSYRIAKKIVSVKGDNSFLTGKKGGLHSNVRKDFKDTEKGIERRDDKIFEAPNATRQVRSLLIQSDDDNYHITGDTVRASGVDDVDENGIENEIVAM